MDRVEKIECQIAATKQFLLVFEAYVREAKDKIKKLEIEKQRLRRLN